MSFIEQIWLDTRYAFRTLGKTPGLTAAALFTLALGIGLNTAIFSAVNAVLLQPLAYRDADQLMQIWETHPVIPRAQVAYPDFVDWRNGSKLFKRIAAYTFEGLQPFNLVVNHEPDRVEASLVSGNLLPMLGINPTYGRNFARDEMQPGHDDAVLLSDALWRRRFAANPRIVGQSVQIDGTLYRVIGILPGSAPFPPWADLLLPISRLDHQERTIRKHHQLEVIGRLQDGVSREQAQAELSGIAKQLESQYPATNKKIGVRVIPLREQLTGQVRTPLLILLGAVGLILLIACANVANLLLARAIGRRKEIALRLALGASRARLIRQLLTESLLLASLGTLLGLLFAMGGLRMLRFYAAQQLPRAAEIAIDWRVLAFTLAITLATSILCGLLPAMQSVRRDQNQTLQQAGRKTMGDSGRRGVRSILVAGEIAVALVVLMTAGLLVRSFERVLAVDPGFRTDHLLTFQLALSPAKYQKPEQVDSFYKRLMSNLKALPSVKEAATVSPVPFTSALNRTRFLVQGTPPPEAGRYPVAQFRTVSPNYFHLMSMAVRDGRDFTPGDAEWNAKPVCMISEAMARRFFSGMDPVGRNLLLGVLDAKPTAIPIVGVVADTRDLDLTTEPEPVLYFPGWYGSVVVRTRAEPLALAGPAREAVRRIDPEQPIAAVQSMDQIVGVSLARRRFSMVLLSAFSALALLLSSVGLYGMVSYSVAQRTREMGLRMALGARGGQLFRSVWGESLRLSCLGLAAGVMLALAATRFLSALLFGVGATDPVTFLSVSGIVLGVAALAAAIPARRAILLEPMTALRQE
jgi:putative ABC transport system permease protein